MGRPSSETRAFLSPPPLLEGPLRLSPMLPGGGGGRGTILNLENLSILDFSLLFSKPVTPFFLLLVTKILNQPIQYKQLIGQTLPVFQLSFKAA